MELVFSYIKKSQSELDWKGPLEISSPGPYFEEGKLYCCSGLCIVFILSISKDGNNPCGEKLFLYIC